MPVVRNVGQMNYAEIEKEITALGQKVTRYAVHMQYCRAYRNMGK